MELGLFDKDSIFKLNNQDAYYTINIKLYSYSKIIKDEKKFKGLEKGRGSYKC